MLLFAVQGQADTPAFAGGGFTTEQPPAFEGTRGWSFWNYNPEGIFVTQLGVFDDGGDGLANSHRIGLWTVSGLLLASAIIPAGTSAPLVEGYRYVSITPIIIPIGNPFNPNMGYIIAAQYSAGDVDDFLTPVSGGLATAMAGWSGGLGSFGWYGIGSDLPLPNLRTLPPMEGSVGPAFLEPNFQFQAVPEPSMWLVVAPCGLAMWWSRRRFLRRSGS
jgi:hypothetical protein